jgi:hypothetical protein
MPRNNSNEELVKVDAIVAASGLPPAWVWGRLDERELESDWDGSFAVRWSTAKKLADGARAEREANDELNRRMREEQERELEREVEEGRRRAAESAAAAGRRVLHGTEVSVPGVAHTPDWAKGSR